MKKQITTALSVALLLVNFNLTSVSFGEETHGDSSRSTSPKKWTEIYDSLTKTLEDLESNSQAPVSKILVKLDDNSSGNLDTNKITEMLDKVKRDKEQREKAAKSCVGDTFPATTKYNKLRNEYFDALNTLFTTPKVPSAPDTFSGHPANSFSATFAASGELASTLKNFQLIARDFTNQTNDRLGDNETQKTENQKHLNWINAINKTLGIEPAVSDQPKQGSVPTYGKDEKACVFGGAPAGLAQAASPGGDGQRTTEKPAPEEEVAQLKQRLADSVAALDAFRKSQEAFISSQKTQNDQALADLKRSQDQKFQDLTQKLSVLEDPNQNQFDDREKEDILRQAQDAIDDANRAAEDRIREAELDAERAALNQIPTITPPSNNSRGATPPATPPSIPPITPPAAPQDNGNNDALAQQLAQQQAAQQQMLQQQQMMQQQAYAQAQNMDQAYQQPIIMPPNSGRDEEIESLRDELNQARYEGLANSFNNQALEAKIDAERRSLQFNQQFAGAGGMPYGANNPYGYGASPYGAANPYGYGVTPNGMNRSPYGVTNTTGIMGAINSFAAPRVNQFSTGGYAVNPNSNGPVGGTTINNRAPLPTALR